MGGITGDADAGGRGRDLDRRTVLDLLLPRQRPLQRRRRRADRRASWRLVFALLGAEGSFGVKGSADRLLPDLLTPAGSPERWRDWVGFPLAIARRAAGRAGRGARAARRRPGAGELPRRARSPSRSARCWRRRRWSRWRRSPSSTTAPTSTCSTPTCGAGCPTCSGIAFLGFLDDALGRGEAAGDAARLARARAGAARGQPLDRGDQGDRGAGAGRLRGLRARARGLALPRRRRAADPRHQPLQPARPAAGAGGEGAGAARRRALPRRLDARAARAARDLRRAGPGRRLASPCASGRCSATPART